MANGHQNIQDSVRSEHGSVQEENGEEGGGELIVLMLADRMASDSLAYWAATSASQLYLSFHSIQDVDAKRKASLAS